MAETRFDWCLDGEEAGTTPWEFASITDAGSADFSLSDAAEHNGTYGYRYTSGGNANPAYGVYTWTNTDKTEYWVRFYIYIASGYALNQQTFPAYLVKLLDGSTVVCEFGIRGNGQTTPNEWGFGLPAALQYGTANNFSLDAWHLIEIKCLVDGENGGVACYIDGSLFKQDLDQAFSLYADTMHMGYYATSYIASGGTVDYDDIVGSETQPGAYSDDESGSAVPIILQQMM